MNAEERAHIEHLLEINRAHLRELETQQAKLGIMAPSSIAVQIADYQRTIADLEGQLSKAMPRHNLPPRDYEQFIGRQKELAELRRLLQPYPKSRAYVITIDGIGGIGKSALALEVAYTFRDQYTSLPETERFEAIVWVSAKRSYLTADGILERRQVFRTLDDLYAAIAQVLDYPAITRARAEEQRTIVEEVLREQRTLLILDNLETIDDEDLLAFLHELPDPTKALVTTRHRIDVARPVRLTGMPHEDALALIVQEAERKEVELAADEQESLWQRTGGCPLAIVWSIGLMGLGGSVESVLRRLGSGQSDIARFCFEESVAQIRGRDAHKLLMALSLFAKDAAREAIGVVADLDIDEFGRDTGLEALLKLSLVNKEGDRFSLLPLTRSFVQAEVTTRAEWISGANRRLKDYFVNTFKDWSGHWRGHEHVEQEFENIIAVIDLLLADLSTSQVTNDDEILEATEIPRAKDTTRLIRTVIRTSRVRGYWNDMEKLAQRSITVARSIGDTNGVGWRYLDISRVNYYRSEFDIAAQWTGQALKEFQPHNHRRGICHANRLLGLLALRKGNVEEASVLLSSAYEEYMQLVGLDGLPHFLGGMGELAEAEGDVNSALSWYQKAVELSRQNDDLPNLAFHLLSLGQVTLARGNDIQALAYYRESLTAAQKCGRADMIALADYQAGALELQQKQFEPAMAHVRQALDLFRRLGMKREQAEAEALLAQLGTADESSGDRQPARE